MCVLADICNHTWIPECGIRPSDEGLRLFLDECDMYEFNCDQNESFQITNYSTCYDQRGPCPLQVTCPVTTPCPEKRRRMEIFYRKSLYPPTKATPPPNLPKHMLHGKRRYTPHKRKGNEATTKRLRVEDFPSYVLSLLRKQADHVKTVNPVAPSPKSKMVPATTVWQTKILKTSIFWKNGRQLRKVFVAYRKTTKKENRDEDFLE